MQRKQTGTTKNVRVIQRCAICRGIVEEENHLFVCPFCTSTYHIFHLAQWLVKKGYCPVCQEELKNYELGITYSKLTLPISQNPQKHLLIQNFPVMRRSSSNSTKRIRQGQPTSDFQRIKTDHSEIIEKLIGVVIFFLAFLFFYGFSSLLRI